MPDSGFIARHAFRLNCAPQVMANPWEDVIPAPETPSWHSEMTQGGGLGMLPAAVASSFQNGPAADRWESMLKNSLRARPWGRDRGSGALFGFLLGTWSPAFCSTWIWELFPGSDQ
jgi:hypothetical protein